MNCRHKRTRRRTTRFMRILGLCWTNCGNDLWGPLFGYELFWCPLSGTVLKLCWNTSVFKWPLWWSGLELLGMFCDIVLMFPLLLLGMAVRFFGSELCNVGSGWFPLTKALFAICREGTCEKRYYCKLKEMLRFIVYSAMNTRCFYVAITFSKSD